MAGAKRYAAALYSLAEEQNQIELIRSDLYEWRRLLAEHRLLRTVFYSPQSDHSMLLEFIDELLSEKASPLFVRFLRVMIIKNRQHLFDAAVHEFDKIYRRRNNQLLVHVKSAAELTDAQRRRLTDVLTKKWNKEILLEMCVEPQLIGGLIIEAEGRRIDWSLRRRLDELNRQLNAAVFS